MHFEKASDIDTCLIITGPTAVGKTRFLLNLLEATGKTLEVISADAYQAYRGMNIGTAKPDFAFQQKIPHHLIDILDIKASYSLAEFVSRAIESLKAIRSRGNIPVVCGGTAYYLKHLLFGLPEAPPSDPLVREKLLRRLETEGIDVLWAELSAVDPVSANRIHRKDTYRVQRALEVYEISGRPLSSFAITANRDTFAGSILVLDRDRETLRERIRDRVTGMFASGLVGELETLHEQGYVQEDAGMKAIGYREFFDEHGKLRKDRTAIETEIVNHTAQFAKRQLTWFRSFPAHWGDPESPETLAWAAGHILKER